MKVFLTTLVGVWVYGALPSLAAELPKNPWAAQEQTVKINKAEKQTQPARTSNYNNQQWVQDRVNAIERHNAQVNEEYAARAKAEREQMKKAAEAAAAEENGGGFMDKLGSCFSEDNSSAANSAPSSANSDSDFEMPGADLLQGYDDLKKETEKSARKLKRSFNSLTNVNIEKTIDDTLKSLQ